MHAPTNPTSRRIGQLIRMLSSDQPGEVGATAQALMRTLIAAGLDIHDLAQLAENSLRIPPPNNSQPAIRRQARGIQPRRWRADGPTLKMDEKLICDQDAGLFRSCGCGGVVFTIMPGVGPHVAQLVCDACERGGRWVARSYFGATS